MNRSHHILLVDDDTATLNSFQRTLRQEGYRVSEVRDGLAALAFVHTCLPDLVVIDADLPQLNGYDAIRTLRGNDALPFIPTMLVMEDHAVEATIRGLDSGADDLLPRSIQRDELLARVRALLRLKRARDDLVREQRNTDLLYRIAQSLHTSLDLDRVLQETLQLVCEALRATRGTIMLIDARNTVWRQILWRQQASPLASLQSVDLVLRDGLAGHTVRSGSVQIVEDALSDERWKSLYDDRNDVNSVLALPLTDHHNHRVAGVMTLVHPERRHFTAAMEPIAAAIAEQISIAVTNASLYTRLREAEEGRERFIHMLTHDLRTPLAGMIGCFDALSTTNLDTNGNTFVELGLRAGDAQMRLIDDLLDMYKAEAGQLTLHYEHGTLAELGQKLYEQLGGAAHDASVTLHLDLPDQPSLVLDHRKLVRVLANLVSNSLKWCGRNGRIDVTGDVNPVTRTLQLRVSDNGSGIDPDDLPHIFDKFYQGHSASNTRGVGLGLAFCALVVEAHAGSINAASTLGAGTTITITLPWKEDV